MLAVYLGDAMQLIPAEDSAWRMCDDRLKLVHQMREASHLKAM